MLGGDMLVAEARMNSIDHKGDRILLKNPNSRNINFFWGFNILLNCAIGSDALYTPYCFECGILQAIFIAVGMAIITQLSIWLYSYTWQYSAGIDYTSMWVLIYGPRFKIVPNICLLIGFISLANSFSLETWQELSEIILHFYPECPDWLQSPWTLSYVMTFISLLFSIFMKTFGDLRFISLISNICMILAGIMVFVVFGINLKRYGFDPFDQLMLWDNSPNSKPRDICLSTYSTLYFIHPIIFHVALDLYKPTFTRVQQLSLSTTSFTCIFSILCGLLGHFSVWKSIPDSNIMLNFESADDVLVALAYTSKICNYICVILSLSCYLYLIAYQLAETITTSSSNTRLAMIVSGIIGVCLNVAFNFVDETIYDWFSVIVHFCNMILAFIMPIAFYFSLFKLSRPLSAILATLLCVVGLAVNIYVVIQAIQAIE